MKYDKKPFDIPTHVDRTYANKGWKNWPDFLGTDTPQRYIGEYATFDKARKFVQVLKIKSQRDWYKYARSGKKLDYIPSNVQFTYSKKGWVSWGNFLGVDFNWRSFEKARKFARNLKLKSKKEWFEYFKNKNKPKDIPSDPYSLYKNKGWKSWENWLDSGTVLQYHGKVQSFKKARGFVKKLKLKSGKEWREYSKSGKKPIDIPGCPDITYKNKGWINMGDWLGNGNKHKIGKWKSFREAKKFVRKLGLKNRKEWCTYYSSGKKPFDIPKAPDKTYKNKGWKGMKDWLGTNK